MLANRTGTTSSLASVNGPARTDTTSEFTFTIPATGTSLTGVIARYQGTGDRNMYLGAIRTVNGVATAVILKNVNGSWKQLAAHSIDPSMTRLRFVVIGNTLSLFVGANSSLMTLVASAIDNSFATGLNGIRASGAAAMDDYFLDDF